MLPRSIRRAASMLRTCMGFFVPFACGFCASCSQSPAAGRCCPCAQESGLTRSPGGSSPGHGCATATWTCRSHHGAVPWHPSHHCMGILGKDGGSPRHPQHGCRAQSTLLWVPLIKGKKFQSTAPLPKDERASPYSSHSPQQLAAEPTLML